MVHSISNFGQASFKTLLFPVILVWLTTNMGFSQNRELPYSNQWTIVSGLTQPIFLNGVNIAVKLHNEQMDY